MSAVHRDLRTVTGPLNRPSLRRYHLLRIFDEIHQERAGVARVNHVFDSKRMSVAKRG